MKRIAATLVLAAGIGALAAPSAGAGAGTHVKITSWHVYTSDHKLHKVKPGRTFRACASAPTTELDAKGKVRGAKKGKAFDEVWTRNGKPDSTFSVKWNRSGSFNDFFSIAASDGSLATGKWKLRLVQGSRAIGSSRLTIKTKHGC
jgi:hypothetical protein